MGPRQYGLISKLLTLLFSTVSPIAAGAQGWGQVGAVNVDANGVPPGGPAQQLKLGDALVHAEHIQTSADGSTQVIFPDQSTMDVGGNSDIVIDEFVYDPKAETGKMAVSATKGILRFVGGKISHTEGVTIETPVATLGVRGGIVTLMLPVPPSLAATDPNLRGQAGQQLVIAHFGIITVTNHVGSVVVRPGFAVLIASADQPIGQPFRPAGTIVQQVVSGVTSHLGSQHGGVPLGNLPTLATPLPPGFGTALLTPPMHPPGADPLGYVSIFGGAVNAARSHAQNVQQNSTVPPPGPTVPPPYP